MSHVLIVEDQAPIIRLLHSWVEAEGESAVTATSAEQALLLASQQSPAVALCDIHLPGGQDGFWLVDQLRVLHPETAVVMTTGIHDFNAAVAGVRASVTDYVVKPFTRARLSEALQCALAEHRARKASAATPGHQTPKGACHDGATGATAALLAVLHAQRGTAAIRALRVAHLAVKLARALDAAELEISDIEHGALLCDVARLDVYAIARKVPHLNAASAIAVASQERFDGNGFPLGLEGEAIPRGARIVAVATAYEELVSSAGSTLFTPKRAVEVLCGERAQEFDPAVLGALRLQLCPSQ